MKKIALVAAVIFVGLSATASAMSPLRRLHVRERAAVNAQAARQGARVIRCHPAPAPPAPGHFTTGSESGPDLLCSETLVRIVRDPPRTIVQVCHWTEDAHERRNGTIRVLLIGGGCGVALEVNNLAQQRTP